MSPAASGVLNATTLAPALLPATPSPVVPGLWSTHMSVWDVSLLYGLPLTALIVIVFILRIVWKPKGGPKFRLPTKAVPTYGTADSDGELSGTYDHESNDLLFTGQSSGQYDRPWVQTFDATFLLGLAVAVAALVVLTCLEAPELWHELVVWQWLVPKFVLMMTVLVVGGAVTRYWCSIDEFGYVLPERSSPFQISVYVRKFVLFAAYLIPLVVQPRNRDVGVIELVWGQLATLLAFVALIQPLRERSVFFMLQFNALDRPEDRPHTLKWSLAGNLVPSMVVLLCFRTLLARTMQENLVYVLILIANVGCGIAEAVNVAYGQHKYSTTTCLSKRRFTRSYEGSAAVFVAAMVFPAFLYFDFVSDTQLWVTMLVLPFAATYADATAPLAMDAPVIMTTIGLVLFVILHVV